MDACRRSQGRRLPWLVCLLAVAGGASVQGVPLFSVSGPAGSNAGLGVANGVGQGAAGEEFTLTQTFTNVSFGMTLEDGGIPLTAWLTTKIGGGSNNTNVVATSTASPGTGIGTFTYTPFSGLTLTAGTYFLVFAAVNQPNDVGWDWTPTPTISQASGVTFLGAFANPGNTTDSPSTAAYRYQDFTAPSTTNSPFFGELDGTPAGAPEPGSLLLAGAGLVWLLARRASGPTRVDGM